MNWYKTIKLAASPKNIINQWKVDDPFLKFFIYTYEPKIDLSKIKSKEDLNLFIQQSMIPSLKNKIDRDGTDNYYKKTISDEEVLGEIGDHPDDPAIQQALAIFKRDPESAKKVFLKAINDDKQKSFDEWWNYATKNYGDNPAFFYSILNPMIESSPATQKNGAPPISEETVESIKNEIGTKGVTQMNVFKKFKKISGEIDRKSSNSLDVDDNKSWIRIDSKQRDPENYQKNKEKLMRFSTGTGWCVAGESYANEYLSKGDFWIYTENDKPRIAIRLTGDKKVEEIRGHHNNKDLKKYLDPYWEQVTNFLHSSDLNYGNNSHYKHLNEIMMNNVDLRTNPEAYQSLLNAIKNDHLQIRSVSAENMKNFPELAQAAAAGYEKMLNSLLDNVENISTTGNEYQQRFAKFQDELDDIPEEVKPYMSNNVQGRLVSVHKNAFMRNPLEYEFFPDDMKAAITPDEKNQAWSNYVGQDPYRYNDLRIPKEARKHIPLRPIVEGWDRLVNQNIDHADNVPSFILKYLPKNYVENKIIADFKKYPCNRTSKGYDKLNRIQEKELLTEDQIVKIYANFVESNKNNKRMKNPIALIPPKYKEILMGSSSSSSSQQNNSSMVDIYSIADRYYKQIINNPNSFDSIPSQEIKNILLSDDRYKNGIISSFKNLIGNYDNDWNRLWLDIPDDVKAIMPGDIKESVASFWLPYVQQDSALIDRLDNHIKPLVQNKLQSQTPPINESSARNWYRKVYNELV